MGSFSLSLFSAPPFGAVEESWIFYLLVWVYPLYLLGALYLVGPILGWCLLAQWLRRYYHYRSRLISLPSISIKAMPIPFFVALWLLTMGLMQCVLIIGSILMEHTAIMMIKSSIGWAKGWALIGLFVWAGAMLPIRYSVLASGVRILLWQSCVLAPFLGLAVFLGVSGYLYTSPLKFLGGGGDQFFKVWLYWIDGNTGWPRWQFFAPWSPALGFYALIAGCIILPLKSSWFQSVALMTCVLLVFSSESRTAVVTLLILCIVKMFFLCFFHWQWACFGLLSTLMCGIFLPDLLGLLSDFVLRLQDSRADSTFIRHILQDIALYRWKTEAFWFGHGNVESGPHIVQFMKIGSHHTWLGLLFIKGAGGFLLLLFSLSLSLGYLFWKGCQRMAWQPALYLMLIFFLYCFTENIEMLSYLLWPGWLCLGMWFRCLAQGKTLNEIDLAIASHYVVLPTGTDFEKSAEAAEK